jgi:hypothetical protein
MSMRLSLLVSVSLLLGCSGSPPPVAPSPPPVVARPNGLAPQPEGQTDFTDEDFQRLAVWFLLQSVRDEEQYYQLRAQASELKDAKPENTISLGGGYYNTHDSWIRLSPVSDVQAAAAKIDFGKVLAVDPAARVILIDPAAEPEPAPADGWPGSDVIDKYILAAVARKFEHVDAQPFAEKVGRDKLVVVLVPGPVEEDSDPLVQKLRKVATTSTEKVYPGFYGARSILGGNPGQAFFSLCVVGPIENVSDVAQALDGVPDVVVDEERRLIVVGCPDLKPGWGEAVQQPAAVK